MAKRATFAEKARRGIKKEKKFHIVKYVRSVLSEKTGHYRFQETMLRVPTGMSLDAYLKQREKETVLIDEPDVQEVERGEEMPAEDRGTETAEEKASEQHPSI